MNNVSITAEYSLSDGTQVFLLSEVLFVSEAIVSRLHQVRFLLELVSWDEETNGLPFQMHKDKETPPLLAFPWFGAQFLSHSFLALERDSRFSIITR